MMFTIGNKVNSIVFDPETYNTKEKMWNDIDEQIKILMRGNYVTVIYKEEDLIIVEYESDESLHSYGVPNPVWVTHEQLEEFSNFLKTPKEFGDGHESFF